MRLFPLGAALAAFTVALALPPRSALACGGCFVPPPTQGAEHGTVVTAHRMALAISSEETTLWDQVRYAGSPAEFAWVLPVKPGARVEVATDALFDVLDAATQTLVTPPLLECQGPSNGFGCSVAPEVSPLVGTFGCAADAAGGEGVPGAPSPVAVVSHGSAGPYEAVLLHATDPGALPAWLDAHGYQIPDDVAPLIADYVAEGFDFAALRLIPSAGVSQMRPVRVVQPGAVPTLPLRMVAAGTGARTDVTLFVIGEGRYTTQNFREVSLPADELVWDFETARSTFASLRSAMLDLDGGGVFMTTYAERGPFFAPVENAATHLPLAYQTTNRWISSTVADAFVEQAWANGETSSTDCADRFDGLADDTRRVVLPCKKDGSCVAVDAATEIDGRTLECDAPLGSDLPLDDLAQALSGMHPRDVWITRLEASLSRRSLDRDLVLTPAEEQVAQPSAIEVRRIVHPPSSCDLPKAAPPKAQIGGGRGPVGGRLVVAVTMAIVVLVFAARRRARAVFSIAKVKS